jgi:hypothetical protein
LSGNVADAEAHLKTGIDGLNTVGASLNAQEDPRGVATLNYGLGVGYFLQGYTRLIQNDPEGFKQQLEQADGGFQMCLNIARDNPGDVYMRERLAPNCTCAQIDAKKALAQ